MTRRSMARVLTIIVFLGVIGCLNNISASADDASAEGANHAAEADWWVEQLHIQNSQPGEELFDHYLYRTADRLDCYYTIEREADRRRFLSAFFYLHAPTTDAASIDEWVRQLNALKGIEAVRDAQRPQVVHLIETSLLEEKSYPLQQRVGGSFSGVLMDLPDALGRLTPGVVSLRGGPIGGLGISGDYDTKAEIQFEDQTVRRVLTDAVPLEGYFRMLWDAETRRDADGKPATQVKFYGHEADDERAKPEE